LAAVQSLTGWLGPSPCPWPFLLLLNLHSLPRLHSLAALRCTTTIATVLLLRA
jgi:hypothetical protein